jgi:hypothetical protein
MPTQAWAWHRLSTPKSVRLASYNRSATQRQLTTFSTKSMGR